MGRILSSYSPLARPTTWFLKCFLLVHAWMERERERESMHEWMQEAPFLNFWCNTRFLAMLMGDNQIRDWICGWRAHDGACEMEFWQTHPNCGGGGVHTGAIYNHLHGWELCAYWLSEWLNKASKSCQASWTRSTSFLTILENVWNCHSGILRHDMTWLW